MPRTVFELYSKQFQRLFRIVQKFVPKRILP